MGFKKRQEGFFTLKQIDAFDTKNNVQKAKLKKQTKFENL